MRKALIATSALALAGAMAAGPASAADMLSVGVGGYMQQWFGYANRDDGGTDADGGWDTQADTEIHIKGALESDSGLKFAVHVEIEGNQSAGGGSTLDESFLRVSGEFGDLEFGSRDHSMVRLHSGISDVGVGLMAGDTQKWIPGAYLDTAGHAGVAGGGDALKLSYISPRVSGLQVGVSYAPDSANKDGTTTPPDGNDVASWGAGLNFQQAMGEGNVTISLGHRSVGQVGEQMVDDDGRNHLCSVQNSGDGTEAGSMEYSAFTNANCHPLVDAPAANAEKGTYYLGATVPSGTDLDGSGDDDHFIPALATMKKADDATYTNAGVGVGFGAFQFNVSYATSDGGAYMVKKTPIMYAVSADTTVGNAVTDAAALKTLLANTERVAFKKGTAELPADAVFVSGADFNWADEKMDKINCNAGTGATACNDVVAANLVPEHTEAVVSDKSKDFDVWGVSVTYTDGPMALSLGHMTHETDAGTERNATMLSASYTLAPGVAWKTSVFAVEDDTGTDDATTAMADESDAEGTAFVTGIALSF